jgi:hypothetical protein
MYGMVLMAAMTGTGDTSSFGHKGGGCTGYSAGCYGSSVVSGGCHGGKHFGGGMGLFGHKKHGCQGSAYSSGCFGSGYGCTGVVAAPVMTAPVMTAPVVAAAPACCPAPVATCCSAPAKHKGGFLGGLCHKKKCATSAVSYAPVAAPCCGSGPVVAAPPVTTVPPVSMPADKK